MKRVLMALCIMMLLLNTAKAWAWWSANIGMDSTHYKITEKVISKLSPADYPDMQLLKFGQYVINSTSGPNDDANAHGGTAIPNGGVIADLWKLACEKYTAFDFKSGDTSAYYNIALMLCIFRVMPPTHSDSCRPPVPKHVAH